MVQLQVGSGVVGSFQYILPRFFCPLVIVAFGLRGPLDYIGFLLLDTPEGLGNVHIVNICIYLYEWSSSACSKVYILRSVRKDERTMHASSDG